MFIFFAYHNFNCFPEKERTIFEIKIYYQSGRIDTKLFNLPKSTEFSLVNKDSRSNLVCLWYYNKKPLGRECGYLVMGVEDYEILSVHDLIDYSNRVIRSSRTIRRNKSKNYNR